MKLSERMLLRRGQVGKPWTSLEQEYGVAEKTFRRLVSGESRIPKDATVEKLADFLGCSQISVLLSAYEEAGIYNPEVDGVLVRRVDAMPMDVRAVLSNLETVIAAHLD